MPANQIGSTQVFLVKGQLVPAGRTMIDITRRHTNGHAYRRRGKRGAPFRMLSVEDFDSVAAREAAVTANNNARGAIASAVYDRFGGYMTNVAILDVEPVATFTVRQACGGLGTAETRHMLHTQWTMQHTGA